jgi:hypothetical protein
MKPAAAFAAGLWTGAAVIAAVGAFYLRVWELGRSGSAPAGRDKLETRIQLLQQEQARATAEEARLKQTIADLQSELDTRAAIDARRQSRMARREPNTPDLSVEQWIVDAVVRGDAQALPKLEEAALDNNLSAIDALALLAEHDNAEALTRAWGSPSLNGESRLRATLLLAATVELNPHGGELLSALFTGMPTNPQMRDAALAGLMMPDFTTRLRQSSDFPVPPHFRPDYAMRLKLVESWRAATSDEQLLLSLDRVRARLAQRATESAPAQ